MENNTIICKTSSTIYEYIMKKLGINIKTETDDMDTRKYPHTYNVVTTKENKKYLFDLQEDMRYIKAHLRTQRFGISMQKDDKEPIINRFELEQIDKNKVLSSVIDAKLLASFNCDEHSIWFPVRSNKLLYLAVFLFLKSLLYNHSSNTLLLSILNRY